MHGDSPLKPSSVDPIRTTTGPDQPVRRRSVSPISRIKFVESKRPDMGLVGRLLEECAAVNQWANFGPLYDRLAKEYSAHMNLGPDLTLTPCANAGIGLEMLARAQAADAGRDRLRWIGSAFSFKNLGRGYFSDMHFVDCNQQGLLDLAGLQDLAPDDYDGIVVTNPFGMCSDFSPYIQFAESTGKRLIIDNAAGTGRVVPDWPWQVFSLHHTKPYGAGEGGLVLSPSPASEFLQLLINYDRIPHEPAYWLNNGKISDISCAFLIARLRHIGRWEGGYLEQRQRITEIFADFNLQPLLPIEAAPLTNSLPVLLGARIKEPDLLSTHKIDVARQYPPLAPRPTAQSIHDQIINFPTHPDLSLATDSEISDEVHALLERLT